MVAATAVAALPCYHQQQQKKYKCATNRPHHHHHIIAAISSLHYKNGWRFFAHKNNNIAIAITTAILLNYINLMLKYSFYAAKKKLLIIYSTWFFEIEIQERDSLFHYLLFVCIGWQFRSFSSAFPFIRSSSLLFALSATKIDQKLSADDKLFPRFHIRKLLLLYDRVWVYIWRVILKSQTKICIFL